ncbi:MAG: acyl-CoA dehydrogenase family protein [Candidatus Tectomicrobia bacterium]|uniref:Acyl-CoA dehydrogenase family protein n=1 Tax=Tectimicrobiota bacterium TaxID=2528274 RepID=A0A933GPP8_UNCTE|nr:acyl-CoA dehydrogenase family protein [Candidatus Tectomicrobia bacterium]
MDFKFTEQQELLRKSVREFAEKEILSRVEQMEETDQEPIDLYKQMAKLNLFGITVPREYGGMGLGLMDRTIVLEEVSRISASVGMALQVFQMGISGIQDYGSEEQKKKYLPLLARGEKFSTMAVTEATGGSDPSGIETSATLDGDYWVLNGRKIFITNSHVAEVPVIIARTSSNPKAFSAFIVEKEFPGFRPGRREKKFGLHGCNTGEIILEGCKVPKTNLLGKEGDGLKVALKGISEFGRSGMAGVALGVLNGCLEASKKFATERILYGKPISALQAIQWHISDIFMDLEISRVLTYRAAWMRDQGIRCDAELAMAKYYATEGAVRSSKKAVDIHGGYGYMKEYAVQRHYRDSQILIASAGTSEIQRIIMARKALS